MIKRNFSAGTELPEPRDSEMQLQLYKPLHDLKMEQHERAKRMLRRLKREKLDREARLKKAQDEMEERIRIDELREIEEERVREAARMRDIARRKEESRARRQLAREERERMESRIRAIENNVGGVAAAAAHARSVPLFVRLEQKHAIEMR